MTLLIIEDDDAFAATLSRRMKAHFESCELASNTEQALKRAEDCRPTHILLDLKLGSESGLNLIAPLKTLCPNSVLILMTGYASITSAVKAIKLGADDYLVKPSAFNDIVHALLTPHQQNEQIITEHEPNVMSPLRLEWEHIQRVLQEHNGNISHTAKALGMHRRTLQRKLQKKPVRQ